jgi:hypothetical protein
MGPTLILGPHLSRPAHCYPDSRSLVLLSYMRIAFLTDTPGRRRTAPRRRLQPENTALHAD